MNSLEPANTDPTGAPRDLLRHITTELHCDVVIISRTGICIFTAAFNNRAPSICKYKPNSLHNSPTYKNKPCPTQVGVIRKWI